MPDIKTLTGKTITLRAVRESDIDDRYAIGRHHEFVHMCGGESLKKPEHPDRSVWENWYNHQMKQEHSWIIDLDGKCIGGARLHNISEQDHSATYAIGIFDPACHSKGIGTEATKLILQYAFEELKVHRVDLKVLDYNKRGIRCYEKCGFKVDGVLRDSALIEGQYYSDIVMSILGRRVENAGIVAHK